jgi:hypothetical protein
MANYRIVTIHLSVYVPEEVVSQGDDAVGDYLMEKQYHEPDFFGEIDHGCFTVTDEIMSDGSDE